MASMSGGESKKDWFKCHKRIYLENKIFDSWTQAKHAAGYEGQGSDNMFAGHFLSLEYRRLDNEEVACKYRKRTRKGADVARISGSEACNGPLHSTPQKCSVLMSSSLLVDESPIVDRNDSKILLNLVDSPILISGSLHETNESLFFYLRCTKDTTSNNTNQSMFSDEEGLFDQSGESSSDEDVSYQAYKARKQLAAIDWNYHLHLPTATNNSGEQITSRQYNQRTKQWDVKIIKSPKGYEYIPVLMAKIFKSRLDDTDIVTRSVSLNESDPFLLAPTIAVKSPPPSKELLKRKSHFEIKHQGN